MLYYDVVVVVFCSSKTRARGYWTGRRSTVVVHEAVTAVFEPPANACRHLSSNDRDSLRRKRADAHATTHRGQRRFWNSQLLFFTALCYEEIRICSKTTSLNHDGFDRFTVRIKNSWKKRIHDVYYYFVELSSYFECDNFKYARVFMDICYAWFVNT